MKPKNEDKLPQLPYLDADVIEVYSVVMQATLDHKPISESEIERTLTETANVFGWFKPIAYKTMRNKLLILKQYLLIDTYESKEKKRGKKAKLSEAIITAKTLEFYAQSLCQFSPRYGHVRYSSLAACLSSFFISQLDKTNNHLTELRPELQKRIKMSLFCDVMTKSHSKYVYKCDDCYEEGFKLLLACQKYGITFMELLDIEYAIAFFIMEFTGEYAHSAFLEKNETDWHQNRLDALQLIQKFYDENPEQFLAICYKYHSLPRIKSEIFGSANFNRYLNARVKRRKWEHALFFTIDRKFFTNSILWQGPTLPDEILKVLPKILQINRIIAEQRSKLKEYKNVQRIPHKKPYKLNPRLKRYRRK